MDDRLISLILTAVTFATAFNLFLLLRILRVVHPVEEPLVPLVGKAVPRFTGRRSADGGPIAWADLAGRPAVLVFLSSGCPDCRSRIPDLAAILPGAAKAGIAFWIVAADDAHDIAPLVGDTPLAEHTMTMDPTAREALNPFGATPLYIFIDEATIVQAGNHLGDEDWNVFLEEMRAFAADA